MQRLKNLCSLHQKIAEYGNSKPMTGKKASFLIIIVVVFFKIIHDYLLPQISISHPNHLSSAIQSSPSCR